MNYAKKVFLSLLILFFFFQDSLSAQNKWSIGLGLQTFKSNIYKPDKNVPPFIEFGQTLSYGGHFVFERNLSPNKSIDIGIGALKIKNDVFIDYWHYNRQTRNLYNTFNIRRNYISIPINFNYKKPLAHNLRLRTSIGLQSNILVYLQDNYISAVEVGYDIYDQYSRINLLGKARIGLRYGQNNEQNLDINLFANYGLNSFASGSALSWLPYSSFSKSLELQFGIELNYFFSH
jgi:hypothetical protein